MKLKTRRLSWKPKRRGDIYCSPACGRGCTHAEYLEAVEGANKLAKKLPGFKPHVWENLGWHFCAVALDEHVCVYYDYSRSYTLLASLKHTHAGNCEWGSLAARSPQKAVQQLKENLRREIDALQDFLKRLEDATK